jgi:predicted peptidase
MTYKFCILTTTLFLIIYSSLAFAQTPQNQKESNETFYFKSSALFRCVIQLPNNYNPDKSYPLVIGLHGGSGSPDNL